MNTYRSVSVLSKPTGHKPIPESTYSYLRTRNRLRAFHMIQDEFRDSGLSQATLAARTKKDAGQLSRILSAPGNLTLDMLSDLMFAISGAVPAYSADHPLDRPARNNTKPDWSIDNADLEYVSSDRPAKNGSKGKASSNPSANSTFIIIDPA